MTEIAFEAAIHAGVDQIFDLIADLGGQDRWLDRSSAFRGTSEVSANPATLGTTYREPGPLGVRTGEVVAYERPTLIAFHQPMELRLHAGTIDILLRATLTPTATATNVRRELTLAMPTHLRALQPLVLHAFRRENNRTLQALKAYAESL
jgi:uncharacterized protein YndB with AHSA1/START domain